MTILKFNIIQFLFWIDVDTPLELILDNVVYGKEVYIILAAKLSRTLVGISWQMEYILYFLLLPFHRFKFK